MVDAVIPAQIKYMLDSLANTQDDVWTRAAFRDRLLNLRNTIDSAIQVFEVEFRKAQTQKKKKVKK